MFQRLPALRSPLVAGSAAFLAATAGPAPAQAQDRSPCHPAYVMGEGDTLYQATQACRVGLADVLRANPSIDDIDDIAVGTRIKMPGAPSGPPTGGPPPADAPGTISLQPRAGAPGAPITVAGEGYRPGATVTIGSGPPQSEWEGIEKARVRADGTVEATVRIPERARPGRQVVFVIHTGEGETIVSPRVDVVAHGDPDAGAPPSDGDRVTLEGRIGRGAECHTLTTRDGDVCSLTGREFETGDHVRVEGRPAEMSFCMQGQATIAVEAVRDVPPPDRDREPAMPRGHVLGPWVARGGDCARPDFEVTGTSAGGQVVETSLDGAPRTGYVRLGDDPAFVFDQPRRELPLERRGPDGLAVTPPGSGRLRLGGETIGGDGRVFVSCRAR